MQNNTQLINTQVLQQVINQVKAADMANQREIRLDIATAKNLSYTLALVLSRLAGNYETLLSKPKEETEVTVQMDGGNWDKNSST
jgi:hypothetical protein